MWGAGFRTILPHINTHKHSFIIYYERKREILVNLPDPQSVSLFSIRCIANKNRYATKIHSQYSELVENTKDKSRIFSIILVFLTKIIHYRTMKKDIVKRVGTEIESVIDSETGEVLEVSAKNLKILVNPSEFCLVYSGLWNVILGNPLSKADIELLSFLLAKYSDGTPFNISSFVKGEVAKYTGKAVTSYNNSTAKLLKYGLIFKVDNRVYKINPRYAFKGSSYNRKKAVIEMLEVCPDC